MINVQIDEENKEVAIELIYADSEIPWIKLPLTIKNIMAIKESLSNEIVYLERYMRDKYGKGIVKQALAERAAIE